MVLIALSGCFSPSETGYSHSGDDNACTEVKHTAYSHVKDIFRVFAERSCMDPSYCCSGAAVIFMSLISDLLCFAISNEYVDSEYENILHIDTK